MIRRVHLLGALMALAAVPAVSSCGIVGMEGAVGGEGLDFVRQPLPEGTELRLLGGERVRLDQPEVTFIVNLWASWCAPCRVELPELQELQRLARKDASVRVIAVNTERHSDEWLETFREKARLEELAFAPFDSKFVAGVGLEVVPLTLVIQDGFIVERHDGYRTTLVDELSRRHAGRGLPDRDAATVAF